MLASEHQPERDWNELYCSTLCGFACDAVVSGFEKHRDGTNAKRRAESGVDSKVAFGLRTGCVNFHVVIAATKDDIRFRARARKRVNQIAERTYDAEV